MVIQEFGNMESFQYRLVSKGQVRGKKQTIHVIIIVLLLYPRLENSNIYHIFFPYELLVKKQS